MMSESSKRHSKFLSLVFILKCLSKASVIIIEIVVHSIHFNTDIIRQFNPFLKGTSVTSQSRDNIPYNDDLNVAFVGASARSEYIQ